MQPKPDVVFAVEQTLLPDGSVHIAVAGQIDAETSCDLLDCIVGGIVPDRRLIVDLAAVTEVDDTGLAALALADRLAQLHRATLQVVNCASDERWRPTSL